MADPTQVADGRSLFQAAVEAGFRDHLASWNDGANSAIRKSRVNPHTLAEADQVVLPVLEPGQVAGKGTDQFHTFTVRATGLLLNLAVQDFGREPLAGRTVRVFLAAAAAGGGVSPSALSTHVLDADGALQRPIRSSITEGELQLFAGDVTTAVETRIRLLIGRLDPPNTIRGQQIRLNNMGYFAGFTEDDVVQLTWAIEEFQFDNGIKPTGRTDDPATFNEIAHVHGDLLESETVP
jgi:hypothetical protein